MMIISYNHNTWNEKDFRKEYDLYLKYTYLDRD